MSVSRTARAVPESAREQRKKFSGFWHDPVRQINAPHLGAKLLPARRVAIRTAAEVALQMKMPIKDEWPGFTANACVFLFTVERHQEAAMRQHAETPSSHQNTAESYRRYRRRRFRFRRVGN